MLKLSSFAAVVVAMVMMTTAPVSGVETYDKLAFLTFNGPVQIPGATLSAGTYRFRLANPATSRNVLQVLSNDGAIVYAMFHTIPDVRASVTDEAVVTFRETPTGVPPAVRSLFYGGEYHGYEVVYAEGGPLTIAPWVPQPEITYTPIARPAPAEPVIEPPFEPFPVEPEFALEPERPFVEPEPAGEPAPELPRTASPLPFIAAGGLLSLLGGVGLWRRRPRNT